jgi:hypothetical protein
MIAAEQGEVSKSGVDDKYQAMLSAARKLNIDQKTMQSIPQK